VLHHLLSALWSPLLKMMSCFTSDYYCDSIEYLIPCSHRQYERMIVVPTMRRLRHVDRVRTPTVCDSCQSETDMTWQNEHKTLSTDRDIPHRRGIYAFRSSLGTTYAKVRSYIRGKSWNQPDELHNRTSLILEAPRQQRLD
jgi:hypothetical protein